MYGQRPSSPPGPRGYPSSSSGAPRSPTMSGMPPRSSSPPPPASPPQMNRQASRSAVQQSGGMGMSGRPQSPSMNPVRPSSPTLSSYQKPVANYSQNSNYGGQPTNPYQNSYNNNNNNNTNNNYNNYNTNNSQYGGGSSRSRPQSPTMSGMQPQMTPPSTSPLQYDNRNRSDGSNASLYPATNEGSRPHSSSHHSNYNNSSNYNTNNSQYGNNNSQYNNYNKNQGSYGNTQTNSSQYSNTTRTQDSEVGGAVQAAAQQNLQIMSNEKRTAEDVIAPAPPGLNLPPNHYVLNSSPLQWTAPADQSAHPYKEHQGEGSQYLRDFILGVNDGLITNLLLVVGLIGGGQTTRAILLAAISSAVAGAIAMGLGELVATKSQNEVVEGETKLEREHFKYHRDREIQQLRGYLMSVGLEGPLLEACVRKIGSNDETLMTVMTRFEFGAEASEELERSPLKAMFMSGRLFFIGALPSTLPFILNDPNIAVALACVFASLCLIGVGIYKTRTTGGSPYRGALENFACGAIGGTISFLIGLAFGTTRQVGA